MKFTHKTIDNTKFRMEFGEMGIKLGVCCTGATAVRILFAPHELSWLPIMGIFVGAILLVLGIWLKITK
jgi:hypothetical protein